MSAHDRYLAGYRRDDVTCHCTGCEHEWNDVLVHEYGASWLEHHDECPECGKPDPEFEDGHFDPREGDDWRGDGT